MELNTTQNSMLKSLTKYLILTFIFLIGCQSSHDQDDLRTLRDNAIKPFTENPYYWQYKGEPIWLVGGSWQDNLFNHPVGLEEHLDQMVSVGANYVRNVMSHRNVGNVFAYAKDENGLFNLDQFNDEYWDRFENFLKLTYDRDIIVQLEIWATWDHYEDHQSLGGWSFHPFNPENNTTYDAETSGLPTEVSYPPQNNPTRHSFFKTVPELDNNRIVLTLQQEFVNKILSYTLEYPHILYTMNNETGEEVEWGDYWADYVREKADEKGLDVQITDMRRNEDIRSDDHGYIFNNPNRYDFVDISQNNAWSGLGRAHYENILWVREHLSEHPRPINNNKNYGAARHGEEESVARMGRILFAGAASARFHRPHPYEDPALMEDKSDFGLGLSPRAQNVIRAISKVTKQLDIEQMEPRPNLIHSEQQAYLLAEPGRQYAIYFPFGGTAEIDLETNDGNYQYRWIQFDDPTWSNPNMLSHDSKAEFTAPDSGHWILVLQNDPYY